MKPGPRHIPNQITNLGDGTALLHLLHGQVAIIDASDAPEVGKLHWSVTRGGKLDPESPGRVGKPHVCHYKGHGQEDKYLSQFLMGDVPEGQQLIHLNGDPWDYRRANLQYVLRSTCLCQRKRWGKRTPYRGVAPAQTKDGVVVSWQACITHNGQKIYIGTFRRAELAAHAWDAKARELRGNSTPCNFQLDSSMDGV